MKNSSALRGLFFFLSFFLPYTCVRMERVGCMYRHVKTRNREKELFPRRASAKGQRPPAGLPPTARVAAVLYYRYTALYRLYVTRKLPGSQTTSHVRCDSGEWSWSLFEWLLLGVDLCSNYCVHIYISCQWKFGYSWIEVWWPAVWLLIDGSCLFFLKLF